MKIKSLSVGYAARVDGRARVRGFGTLEDAIGAICLEWGCPRDEARATWHKENGGWWWTVQGLGRQLGTVDAYSEDEPT